MTYNRRLTLFLVVRWSLGGIVYATFAMPVTHWWVYALRAITCGNCAIIWSLSKPPTWTPPESSGDRPRPVYRI